MSDRLRTFDSLVTRRFFLGAGTAVAASIALPEVGSAQTLNTGSVNLPDGRWERIVRDNFPIVRLFPFVLTNYKVTIVEGEYLAGEMNRTWNGIETKIGVPKLDKLHLDFLEVVVWHEISGHGFDLAHDMKPSKHVGSFIDPIMPPVIESPTSGIINLPSALGGRTERAQRLHLLTEFNHYPQPDPTKHAPIVIGHPWDNWREVFASASTVAAKFPNQLISALNKNPEHAAMVANTVLKTIEAYLLYSSVPVRISDLRFDRQFILELQKIGGGLVTLIPEQTKVSRRNLISGAFSKA